MKDRTKDMADYQRMLEDEKEFFSTVEVTEDLVLGGVHARTSWKYYWERVWADMSVVGVELDVAARLGHAAGGRPVRILSLGSGHCGNEIALAQRLTVDYQLTCMDMNEGPFEDAARLAAERGVHLDFRVADLNFVELPRDHYDLVVSFATLHHLVNLEHVLEQVRRSLVPGGLLHAVEVIGANRRLIYPENEDFANRLLGVLPGWLRDQERLVVHEDEQGMEGVRQEELLELLHAEFVPEIEHGHGAFMRYVCHHPELGVRLDPDNPRTRPYLDFLVDSDVSAVRRGLLRPLELWAIYRPRS